MAKRGVLAKGEGAAPGFHSRNSDSEGEDRGQVLGFTMAFATQ